jgi:ATP-dependent DNA helicase PIF1
MFKNNLLQVESQLNQSIQDMLKEANINVDYDDNLSDSQKKALELFKEGRNLLVLGAGGCGKSFLIKTMEEYIKTSHKNKKMYLCSTTGISAYNIGGMTIHSFMGIGTGDMPIENLIKKVRRKKMYRDRIMNTDILVIDEVSMLSGELFEKLHLICQNIRKSNLFFGGIQVIFTGDFLQLLPVFNKNKDLYKELDERLIIESPLFGQMFNKDNIVILQENFRQQNDKTFINLLLKIRDGSFMDEEINLLNSRHNLPNNINEHVHLVSSNRKAQIINETQLNKLKTPKVRYVSSYSSSGKDSDIKELLTNELKFQLNQKGINDLTLKKGARVMLIKNIDVSIGLVNGALGTIVDFIPDPSTSHDIPIVKFDTTNSKHPISVVSWELEIDGCKGMAYQIPLMLAYSVTIHKSQSLTLDSAILDLEDCFCDHQIYVALSRLKSLNGLYLKSFNKNKISVNTKMRDFLETLIRSK